MINTKVTSHEHESHYIAIQHLVERLLSEPIPLHLQVLAHFFQDEHEVVGHYLLLTLPFRKQLQKHGLDELIPYPRIWYDIEQMGRCVGEVKLHYTALQIISCAPLEFFKFIGEPGQQFYVALLFKT